MLRTYFLLAQLVLSNLLWAQSSNVPLEHWAYAFLDRLETRGLFVSEDFSTRPYSREAFADIIGQIDENVKEDSELLSRSEKGLFEQLKGEFYDELQVSRPEIMIQESTKEPHLYTWKTEDVRAHFDANFRQQIRLESKEDVDLGVPASITTWGIASRVKIKEGLAIYVDASSSILSDTDTLTNTSFNPNLGLPVTEDAFVDVAITDNVSAYMVFRLPWLDLEFGRDLAEWGPGAHGNLMLSRSSNFYDMLKTTFRYKQVKFEFFHAWLNAADTKYLAAHRLEIRPTRAIQLAISESVVYGNRDVEPLYLNPFVPFIIAERHLGNQDNNMVSLDGTLYLTRPRMKLYGEVFFDDLSLAKDLDESFVNKWAILAGAFWTNPFGFQSTDFRFEAVRIQPFVYSHKEAINTYTNYNNIIGHWLGPDADNWYFELGYQALRDLRVALSWEQRRRGQNDVNKGARPEDDRIKFLDGVVERNRFYGFTGEWQIFRDVFLSANYQYVQSKNLHHEAGLEQNNHRLFVRLFANY